MIPKVGCCLMVIIHAWPNYNDSTNQQTFYWHQFKIIVTDNTNDVNEFFSWKFIRFSQVQVCVAFFSRAHYLRWSNDRQKGGKNTHTIRRDIEIELIRIFIFIKEKEIENERERESTTGTTYDVFAAMQSMDTNIPRLSSLIHIHSSIGRNHRNGEKYMYFVSTLCVCIHLNWDYRRLSCVVWMLWFVPRSKTLIRTLNVKSYENHRKFQIKKKKTVKSSNERNTHVNKDRTFLRCFFLSGRPIWLTFLKCLTHEETKPI